MKVLFLCDAGGKVGLGHISRCSALAQTFENLGVHAKFCLPNPDCLKALYPQLDFLALDWLVTPEEIISLAPDFQLCVVDSYHPSAILLEKFAAHFEHLLCFDDDQRIQYPVCATILNPAPGISSNDYPRQAPARCLCGTTYWLLRPEFKEVRKMFPENTKSVLISLGSNGSEFLVTLTSYLVEEFPNLNFRVLGANQQQRAELNDKKNVQCLPALRAAEVNQQMRMVDLAVSAAGQTLGELLALGVPTIGVELVSNQKQNLEALSRLGAVFSAGAVGSDDCKKRVAECIRTLNSQEARNKLSQTAQKIIDGKGARRVAKTCIQKYLAERLKLAEATTGDCESVFEISNQTLVRQASFNSEALDLEKHRVWFSQQLNSSQTLFLVARLQQALSSPEKKVVAQLRFKVEDSSAIISISVASVYQSWGIGRDLILQGMELCLKRFPQVRSFHALVKKSNLPSVRFFESCDFQLKSLHVIQGHEAIEFIMRVSKT